MKDIITTFPLGCLNFLLRKIIVVKKHKLLEEAWTSRSFSLAKILLEDRLRPEGFEIDESQPPVQLKGKGPVLATRTAAAGFNYKGLERSMDLDLFSVRAKFDDEAQVDKLREKHLDEVVGIFADPIISAFNAKPYCKMEPIGNLETVEAQLGVSSLNLTGKDVRIAIIGTGINSSYMAPLGITVSRGWSPLDILYEPGTAPPSCGTMCAFDALISAPYLGHPLLTI